MDITSFKRLKETFALAESKYGRTLISKCRLLTEEEVRIAINYQKAYTLRKFLELNQDWYVQCLKQIDV